MITNTHFPKAKKFWYMGEFHEWSETNVHIMSHALHYGTSIFEGIRAYDTPKGSSVFRLEEHIDRLFYSASILSMKLPYTKQEIIAAVKGIMRENELDSAYIRPLAFYAYGNLGLVPKACPAELVIGAWEWGAYLGDKSDQGVHAYFLPWRRIHHSQFDMKGKLGGLYVLSTIGGMAARNKGFDEAIYLNIEGNVSEGPGENIFIVKDGVVKTNNHEESILEGITRTSLLQIADDMNIPTKVGPITKTEFLEADEAFFSGTAVEITSITKVTDDSTPDAGGRETVIGNGRPGEMKHRLEKAFRDIVGGRSAAYENWLSYVNE